MNVSRFSGVGIVHSAPVAVRQVKLGSISCNQEAGRGDVVHFGGTKENAAAAGATAGTLEFLLMNPELLVALETAGVGAAVWWLGGKIAKALGMPGMQDDDE